MVAVQFAQQAHVNLNLPDEVGEQKEDKPVSTLVINILQDGSIVIDNSKGALSIEQVDAIIHSTIQEDSVTWKNISIRADEETPAGSLNEVLIILSKHGLSATNIATESP